MATLIPKYSQVTTDNRTIAEKFIEITSVKDYGAVGDGTTDDTVAIQAAITQNQIVAFPEGSYLISTTIVIPSNRELNLGTANIIAACGSNPIFSFGSSSNSASGLKVTAAGGGGVISGTADSVFKFEGTTSFVSSPTNYAKQIRIDGLNVSSATINKFIEMKTAVRQVFVTNCQAFTPNGVLADGKCVEVMFDKCIIFSATGAVGTYCFKLSSALGSGLFNEGWTISDSTIDAAEYSFDLADIFVFEVANNYIGKTAIIRQPTSTTHTREILINGNVIGPGAFITFATSTSGNLTNSIVANNIFVGGSVVIQSNQTRISVRNNKFESSSSGVAVTIANNANNIVCEGLDIDSTYAGGIIMSGATGEAITIRNITYQGTGNTVYATRPVLFNAIDVGTGSVVPYLNTTGNIVPGSYAVAATVFTTTVNVAKGQTGFLNIAMAYSGTNATQLLTINPPAGMSFPGGSGWSAQYIYPKATSGYLSVSIPYYCTADIAGGTLSMTNTSGLTMSVDYHSWFALTRG